MLNFGEEEAAKHIETKLIDLSDEIVYKCTHSFAWGNFMSAMDSVTDSRFFERSLPTTHIENEEFYIRKNK